MNRFACGLTARHLDLAHDGQACQHVQVPDGIARAADRQVRRLRTQGTRLAEARARELLAQATGIKWTHGENMNTRAEDA